MHASRYAHRYTNAQVPGCKGYLFDSTIDFGDNLPEKHITRGYKLASEAGLCIVLGSRCSVSPACDMPISVGQSGRDLVVVRACVHIVIALVCLATTTVSVALKLRWPATAENRWAMQIALAAKNVCMGPPTRVLQPYWQSDQNS